VLNYGRLYTPAQLGMLRSVQLKHIDVSINSSVNTTGSYYSITDIPCGASEITRVGNVIHVKHLDVELFVNYADSTNFVKAFLVVTPNGQQGAPTYASWWYPPDSDGYIVLKESMSSLTASLNPTACVRMRHTFPGKGLYVRYDTTSSSSEIMNRIGLSLVSDSSAIPSPTILGYVRIYFTDA